MATQSEIQQSLKGKHLLCTEDWTREQIEETLRLAVDMKTHRFDDTYATVLRNRTFFMFFYNPSVRTRQSFECAATELGGHAQFLEPKSMRLKTATSAGETVEDAALVMSRYAAGIGIRILEDKVSTYGEGHALLQEYAQYATIPIISMAHDKFHPCQGLADAMGLRKHLGANLKGKKLLLTWGHGALARSWCSVQEAVLLYARLGMEVTVASPAGYDLDPEVIGRAKAHCAENGQPFTVTNDPEAGYANADVVYSRNWMTPHAYVNGEFQKAKEIEKAMAHKEWICDARKMAFTRNGRGLYIHPMPIDRGHEVTDEVASGPNSIIYDVAENRLHVQKAIMALTMV